MTTDELICWLRLCSAQFGERSIMRENLAEAADRLEELDKRVAIMAESKEPIRCKDCRFYRNEIAGTGWRPCIEVIPGKNWFCGYAEAKE